MSLSQFLAYSAHADFSFPTTRQVETVPAMVLAAGGLWLAALLAGLARRRKLFLGLTLMALFLAMVSCGGGGGGGDDNAAENDSTGLPTGAQSVTVNGLLSGTTYYWRMIARDSHGAATQSAVRTILVQ